MTLPAQLPTIGPLVPIGPELERELALLLEGGTSEEAARRVCAWAFERGLAMRPASAPGIAFVVVARDGTTRAARIVEAPAARRRQARGAEWMSSLPARRR